MQTFQDRVLKRIADVLCYYGYQRSIDYSFPNVGRLYGHNPNVIVPAVTIGFDFQSPGYTLRITIGTRQIPSQVGRPDYFDFYYENASVKTRFWNCLEAELKQLEAESIQKERKENEKKRNP